MAIDNLPTSDESRLSGAYIRTLVKQLTTSKPTHTTKDDITTLLTNDTILVGQQYTTTQPTIIPIDNENNKINNNSGMAKPKIQNPQGQHKKQIRRRLHTSRPYQERLLNMAEARKEIVTALKFHRASMKQASEKKQQQQQLGQSLGEPKTIESLLPFTSTNVMVDNNFCYYPSYNNNNNINNNNCYNHWVNSSIPIIEQPKTQETLNIIPLPNQTLGLNLNLKAFANLDTTFGHNNVSSIITPSSSTSTRRRPIMSSITPRDHGESTTSVVVGQGGGGGGVVVDNMHQSLDEHEMENIRSIGEQHQIVWDDTLDLVKWFKFVKGGVEFGNNNNNNIKGCNNDNNNNNNNDENNNEYISFEEFPPWLSGNDDPSFFQPQHLEESSSEGTSLP